MMHIHIKEMRFQNFDLFSKHHWRIFITCNCNLFAIMIWILFLLMLGSFGDAVNCPGGEHKCLKTLFSESSCCELTDGSYGCCPMPDAVCCSDGVHCCPQDSQCDLVKQMCISKRNGAFVKSEKWHTIDASTLANEGKNLSSIICESGECPDRNKRAAIVGNSGPNICPDGKSCAGICCPVPYRDFYGCCAYPTTVCCSDGQHCCSENSKCCPDAQHCCRSDYICNEAAQCLPRFG